jgi:hypothetical protein
MIVLGVTGPLAKGAIQLPPMDASLFLAEEGHLELAVTWAEGEF